MKPRIREVIVVEGRYDRNTLLQAVDAAVVETGGFAVFNDREKTAYLRRLAEKRGLILLTDPDGAGFVIRNRLKGVIPPDRLKQAYVPDVYGKERRKKKGGKEGKLGVEGMPPQVLVEALRRAGATFEGNSTAPAAGGPDQGRPAGKGPHRPRLRREARGSPAAAGTAGAPDGQRPFGGAGSAADPGGIRRAVTFLQEGGQTPCNSQRRRV